MPRQRFFPVGTRVGRWLVSTPLNVGGLTIDTVGDEFQVRIVARGVARGRVEFALQQQADDGGWGERLLPRQRFFPVGTRVGRWLVSTPLALTVRGWASAPDRGPGAGYRAHHPDDAAACRSGGGFGVPSVGGSERSAWRVGAVGSRRRAGGGGVGEGAGASRQRRLAARLRLCAVVGVGVGCLAGRHVGTG